MQKWWTYFAQAQHVCSIKIQKLIQIVYVLLIDLTIFLLYNLCKRYKLYKQNDYNLLSKKRCIQNIYQQICSRVTFFGKQISTNTTNAITKAGKLLCNAWLQGLQRGERKAAMQTCRNKQSTNTKTAQPASQVTPLNHEQSR